MQGKVSATLALLYTIAGCALCCSGCGDEYAQKPRRQPSGTAGLAGSLVTSAGTSSSDADGGGSGFGASVAQGANAGAIATAGTKATSSTPIAGSGGRSTTMAKAGAQPTGGMATSTTPAAGGATPVTIAADQHWVASWAAGQQLTEASNNPPSPGLTDNTLRQVIHVSTGGTIVRLRFSNAFGDAPVTMHSVHCAVSAGSYSIDTSTDVELKFSGSSEVTIPTRQEIWSDPFNFALTPLSNLSVSIYFGATAAAVTGHPGSRTTSYLQSGDAVSEQKLASAKPAEHWYILAGLDVAASLESRALVILGDSITDGRGSTTNGNDRWPDVLSRRLQASQATQLLGVVNQGIGGNAVVSGGLGPTAVARFTTDVLNQSAVRWLLLLEGVNDIGYASSPTIASNLINAFQQFVTQAHARNIIAYGIPILPFGGNSYYTADHEAARQAVNTWIRTPGNFDAVIDLEAVVSDPTDPSKLKATYDSGDHLHLNSTGYQAMANAVNLALFK